MKICLALLFCIGFISASAQTTNPKYDSTLAKKVGADDYGMKSYVFVILKTGDNVSTDKKIKDSCFAGHMKNMDRLVKENKLVVAGPFGKNDNNFRGLFILNVKTIEEAKALLETDPAVKARYLAPEMYPWYGSAALSEYLEASDKVWKKGF
jgi:uncharacterized protein YciI